MVTCGTSKSSDISFRTCGIADDDDSQVHQGWFDEQVMITLSEKEKKHTEMIDDARYSKDIIFTFHVELLSPLSQ